MSKEVSFHEAMKARSEGKIIGGINVSGTHEWFGPNEPIRFTTSHSESMRWQIKPEPRTFCFNIYNNDFKRVHMNRQSADIAKSEGLIECVKVVEVIDEENLK